ncbi:hypothetical protein [Yoonia sediminilitoris]|uniref:hypothetical protein n=1 Tax=Yoonia sediminilitoris TaxID=1286148 RepID=UPI001FEBB33F|nr:hypothetical protein [Yoonia sediminilitoris]
MSVLQLDTDFPRVPGDVGCPATYCGTVEVIRIPNATVGSIVIDRPDLINITPFEKALHKARGDLVVTSCGFLSTWQEHLSARSQKPFISSALTALDALSQHFAPQELLILTFDANSLMRQHLGTHPDYLESVVGLPKQMELYQVISQNRTALDVERVAAEMTGFIRSVQRTCHKHILLECTNLPPYKAALRQAAGLPISDILTCIEARQPGTIQPRFLD